MEGGGFRCGQCRELCLQKPELALKVSDRAPVMRLAEREVAGLLKSLAWYSDNRTALAKWLFDPPSGGTGDGCVLSFRRLVNTAFGIASEAREGVEIFERLVKAFLEVSGNIEKGETTSLLAPLIEVVGRERYELAVKTVKEISTMLLSCASYAYWAAGTEGECYGRALELIRKACTALFYCGAAWLCDGLRPVGVESRFLAVFRSLFVQRRSLFGCTAKEREE
ncbi:hypothetical protein [Desulfovirgula thermocuniculi]|uniref:hypothetical protein n=1 Tax=Desulfovirgula thermocuniculi TaxID=348842 RepID=UPI0012EC7573|nr:hypothetical protein [Desulfovirgula thermocuniculi]